jgi:hypothetical protein
MSRILPCIFAIALGSPAFADSGASFLNYQDIPMRQPPPPPSAGAVDIDLENTWGVTPPPAASSNPSPTPAPKATVKKGDLLAVLPAPTSPAAAPVPVAGKGGAVPMVPVVATPAPTPLPRSTTDLPVCVGSAPEDGFSSQSLMAPVLPSGPEMFACIPEHEGQLWSAEANHTVRTTLQKWADSVGWTVVWKAERDWTIPAGFTHYGQFEAASTWMFRQLAGQGVLCKVRYYEGNRTVVVSPLAS